jgi:hypothetical protein
MRASSPINNTASEERNPSSGGADEVRYSAFIARNDSRIILSNTKEVADLEVIDIFLKFSPEREYLEKSRTLFTSPNELIEISGSTRYFLGIMANSIDDDGLISILPFLSMAFREEGCAEIYFILFRDDSSSM